MIGPDGAVDLAHINANMLVALDLLLSEGSVARAADRQGVSASAMSHTLRSLREMFGDPLLTRTGAGMVPTPLAEQLRSPLRRALRDLQRAVSDAHAFDPGSSERSFVLAAPDFISTLLLPHVAAILTREAPGIDVEVRPVQRRGNALVLADAAKLAEGDLDLVLAAVLDDIPGILREPLYEERFVCLVRADHPEVGESIDLQRYAAIPHIVISVADGRSSTWIDEVLATQGLARRVALRTRSSMAAPLITAESDMVLTCPYQLARYFAARLPLRILEPPLQLPRYTESLGWHQRFDADPGLRWLRRMLGQAAAAAIPPPGP